MADSNTSALIRGHRAGDTGAAGPGAIRRFSHVQIRISLLLGLLAAAAFQPAAAQTPGPSERRVLVSLADQVLWLMAGEDTLLTARVATGREKVFFFRGKKYDWRTPHGDRVVLAKRENPVWKVPDWHYYERASSEGLELVEMVRNVQYPLADGSRLEVRGGEVVRIRGSQYWTVPQGREIVVDGVLYAPPAGTLQRQVPGVLGTRALDLGDGIMIHGTSPYNRASIGAPASHGCIRLAAGDIERLFEMVPLGTRVTIY